MGEKSFRFLKLLSQDGFLCVSRRLRKFLIALSALSVGAGFTGNAQAAGTLGAASAYNLFATGGNVMLNGSDSEGAVAANGNIVGTNYFAVNSKTSGSVALLASGNISGSYSSYGDAYAGGTITNTITYYNGSSGHPNTAPTNLPVNFSSADAYLINENAMIYAMGGTAGVMNSGNLTFNASQNGANYFTIDGASLYNAGSINFSSNGKSNVSFLVNVTSVYTTYNATTNPFSNAVFRGTVGTMVDNQQNLGGINRVLFNLNPSITGFSASGTQGSFLAPNANFNGEGSSVTQLDGNLIVKSYNQNAQAVPIEMHTQYNGNPTFYDGYMPTYNPTPATPGEQSLLVGLGIGGLRAAVACWRRRRA